MPTPFDIFRQRLLAAANGVLRQRGYQLQDDPIQFDSGLFRFAGRPAGGAQAFIDVQLLLYRGGGPSRFEVKLWRSDHPNEKVRLGIWLREQGVVTLADDAGWWEFATAPDLEAALADAAGGLEHWCDSGRE